MNHPLVFPLLALAVGLALGAATAWSELRSDDPTLVSSATRGPGKAVNAGKVAVPDREPQPRAKIEGDSKDFNFGSMQRGETQKHTFVIRNVGEATLTLHAGKVSCTCTAAKLSENSVAPGETAEVAVEWTPKTYSPDFRQTAEVITNDPERQVITFSITGHVLQAVRPIPEGLTLSRVVVSEPQVYSVKVYSYLADNLELTKLAVEPEKYAAHIALAQQPLTAEELAAEPTAKAGHKVTITFKPGLPLGPLHGSVHIETNQKDVPPVEVPLHGTIVSDVSFAQQAGLDLNENIFLWGPVTGSEGKTATLYVTVKGKDAEKVQLKVGQVDPADVLQVAIGDVKPVNGDVRIYPLTLTVPPGAMSVNRLGGDKFPYGKIIIETTHPTAPQLLLYVRFAVQ